jgi:hypothetical protein
MINRRVTRVLLNANEVTEFLITANGTNYVFPLATTDTLYVGFHGKFSARYFQVGVANTVVADLTVEYWDGTTWQFVDDFIDQTSVGGKPFAQSGYLSWANKTDWTASNQAGTDADLMLYWVRIKTTVNLDILTALKSILNIYSDDNLLRAYFPELISDANYLPAGKTNFLDQHIGAKDLVVLRLKQRKIINDEFQIIESNDVAIAAVYAAAMLILQPIATSPDTKAILDTAKQGFDDEIGRVSFQVDANEDGVVSDYERVQLTSVKVVRR